jgi:hypothetical protein
MVINHILKIDQYTSINNLLGYYQMELRWVIQKRLLEIFSELCKLNFVVVEIIINSILPMELARYWLLTFINSVIFYFNNIVYN